MNVEKRLDPWMNLCHLYLAAVLKREVDEAREAKEQRRQESARLAQELRCVEERNRWKSYSKNCFFRSSVTFLGPPLICHSFLQAARQHYNEAFQLPY